MSKAAGLAIYILAVLALYGMVSGDIIILFEVKR